MKTPSYVGWHVTSVLKCMLGNEVSVNVKPNEIKN